MSATRIAVMAKRFARQVQLGSKKKTRRSNLEGNVMDMDPFTGE